MTLRAEGAGGEDRLHNCFLCLAADEDRLNALARERRGEFAVALRRPALSGPVNGSAGHDQRIGLNQPKPRGTARVRSRDCREIGRRGVRRNARHPQLVRLPLQRVQEVAVGIGVHVRASARDA